MTPNVNLSNQAVYWIEKATRQLHPELFPGTLNHPNLATREILFLAVELAAQAAADYEVVPEKKPNEPVYNEYRDIVIPEFLRDTADWEDQSWHNDITANSVYKGVLRKDGERVTIRVWVFHPDPKQREAEGSSLYTVCLIDDNNSDVEDVPPIECETDAQAQTVIQMFLMMWST